MSLASPCQRPYLAGMEKSSPLGAGGPTAVSSAAGVELGLDYPQMTHRGSVSPKTTWL